MLRNMRQIRGEYDPDVQIAKNRSKVYPKVTRVKCVSVIARLMQLLFPVVEKNWTLAASPVPSMDRAVLQLLLDALPNAAAMTDEQINQAIIAEAQKRTAAMSVEIEDQLRELGGQKELSYVMLCKKVIQHGVRYGIGVLKGPLVREEQITKWRRQGPKLVAYTETSYRPYFHFVPCWNYYNDHGATDFGNQDGEFERVIMSRHQLEELADMEGFDRTGIMRFLRANPKGNYQQRSFEAELRSLGTDTQLRSPQNKYEVLCYWGSVQASLLRAHGVKVDASVLDFDFAQAHVWILDGVVIKAELNPYEGQYSPYHKFVFEDDDVQTRGVGLPEIMRDSQLGASAAVRMMVDNAAVTAGPMYEVNRALIDVADDDGDIHAFKTFYRDDDGPLAQYPAVREIITRSHIPELMQVYNAFRELADTETLVNPAAQGDFTQVASEPFRTSGGTSQLLQGAALPFRDVVRNFDQFTLSVFSAMVAWNLQFNKRQDIRGDHQVIARGADSLMAKEVRAVTVDAFVATMRPEEAKHINFRNVVVERAKVRDLPTDELLLLEDEVRENDNRQAAAMEQQRLAQQSMLDAQVKETIAAALQKLAMARKNAVAADQGIQELDAAIQQGGEPEPAHE